MINMKFTCTQENLQKGLSIVNHLAGKNTTLPILNNVLLKAENGVLELSTTNLEVGVKCQVRGKIEQEGAFTVQARLLSDYVNLLPSQPVELELSDAELNVSCGKYRTKVKGMSAEDFPLIASVEGDSSVQIPIGTFKEALGQVLFSVALDETRPEISGVYFQLSKKGLTPLPMPESYNGQSGETKSVDFGTLIIANKSLSEEMAYLITKTICENKDAMAKAHKAWSNFKPELAGTPANTGIPLHPGALKYYQERGWR